MTTFPTSDHIACAVVAAAYIRKSDPLGLYESSREHTFSGRYLALRILCMAFPYGEFKRYARLIGYGERSAKVVFLPSQKPKWFDGVYPQAWEKYQDLVTRYIPVQLEATALCAVQTSALGKGELSSTAPIEEKVLEDEAHRRRVVDTNDIPVGPTHAPAHKSNVKGFLSESRLYSDLKFPDYSEKAKQRNMLKEAVENTAKLSKE